MRTKTRLWTTTHPTTDNNLGHSRPAPSHVVFTPGRDAESESESEPAADSVDSAGLQAQVNATAADDSELHLSRITEMTILTIKLIVEFSKRLTFFDHLLKDDQITLLKVDRVKVGRRSDQG